MGKNENKNDKSTWAIGGGVLMGIGVGFFFLQVNPLAFIGCIMAGLGVGLMITSIIATKNKVVSYKN
jgi:Na+/melibiose symporter-like transporter